MFGVRHDSADRRPRLGSRTIVSTVGCSALVALGAWAGSAVLAAALIGCGLLVAWGWPVLLDLPRPPGSSAVLVVGVAAVGSVELLARQAAGLRWLTTALAVGLMAAFLHELLRSDGRRSLTLSIAGAVFGLAVIGSGAFHLDVLVELDARPVTYAACAGVVAGTLVDAGLARTAVGEWSLPIGLLVAAAAGVVIGLASGVAWNAPMLTGLVCSGLTHALRRVVGTLPRANQVPAAIALGAACPLLVGIAPYAVLWALSR